MIFPFIAYSIQNTFHFHALAHLQEGESIVTFQELEAMKLQELRTMGKELGVDSPTTYPKRELVLKIMEKNGIVVDQNDLPAPPKRRGGRPRKIRPGE